MSSWQIQKRVRYIPVNICSHLHHYGHDEVKEEEVTQEPEICSHPGTKPALYLLQILVPQTVVMEGVLHWLLQLEGRKMEIYIT